VHPRDLVLTGPGGEILVEAKTVRANAELAVREAIGQLFSYRHFWYRHKQQQDPRLLALFSEPIGDAFVALLGDLEISAVWFERGSWRGSQALGGLVDVA
jgi:hypothetical protein